MGIFKAPKINTSQRVTLTFDQSELVFDTDLNRFYGGDGTTSGGFPVGFGVGNTVAPDIITVDSTALLSKSVDLNQTPLIPESVTVSVAGGPEQLFNIDYTISNNVLSWNGLGLDGILEIGDILIVRY